MNKYLVAIGIFSVLILSGCTMGSKEASPSDEQVALLQQEVKDLHGEIDALKNSKTEKESTTEDSDTTTTNSVKTKFTESFYVDKQYGINFLTTKTCKAFLKMVKENGVFNLYPVKTVLGASYVFVAFEIYNPKDDTYKATDTHQGITPLLDINSTLTLGYWAPQDAPEGLPKECAYVDDFVSVQKL